MDDTGAAFVGWSSGCSVSASGYETYYSIARFAKREWMAPGSHPLFSYYPPHPGRWVDNPKVFSSARAARRALERIRQYHFRELAIVD